MANEITELKKIDDQRDLFLTYFLDPLSPSYKDPTHSASLAKMPAKQAKEYLKTNWFVDAYRKKRQDMIVDVSSEMLLKRLKEPSTIRRLNIRGVWEENFSIDMEKLKHDGMKFALEKLDPAYSTKLETKQTNINVNITQALNELEYGDNNPINITGREIKEQGVEVESFVQDSGQEDGQENFQVESNSDYTTEQPLEA